MKKAYEKIELPAAYQPNGYKFRDWMPKGYHKVLYLYEKRGIIDWTAIRATITSHYYALADEKGMKGKRRQNQLKSRKNSLKKAIEKVQKII